MNNSRLVEFGCLSDKTSCTPRLTIRQNQLLSTMNPENSGMRSGGVTRSDSPSSGSHVSASNELPVKLVSEISAMDYEMKTLENKIKRKKEEEERLSEAKSSNMSSQSSVRKQLILLQDRERSFTISLNRVKDSNSALEGLELAVIQNLKAIKISNDEQKFQCNNVIKKYSMIINSHQESFAALPWVKEKKRLSVGVEKKRIILGRKKMRQQGNKANLRLLEQISEKRKRIEILRLSILMTEREKRLRDGLEEDAKKRMVEQELRSLEQQKCLIQEKIASRTQEMILRIMNRSNVGPQKLSGSNVAHTKTSTHEEMNKTMNRSIKDRLGISKRQVTTDTNLAAQSIRDRLGISRKQLNVSLTLPESSQIREDGVKESNSPLAPSTKYVFPQPTGEKSAGPHSPTSSKGDAAESLEICSNKEMIHSEEVEQNNENCNELTAQTSLSPASQVPKDENPGFTERASLATAAIPNRAPPLKAILKPSSSLTRHNEMSRKKPIPTPAIISPPRFDHEDIPAAANMTKDAHSATTLSTQNPPIPLEACGGANANEKRSTVSDRQPDEGGSVNGTEAPAPKKLRVTQKMPPPRPTTASQKQQMKRPNQPPKTPKRVSFVPNDEENRESEATLGKGFCSQQGTSSNPTPQSSVVAEVEMDSGESSPKRIEPDSGFVEPVDVSANRPSTSQLPTTYQKENQASQQTGDEFRHLFSPSLQPSCSAPQQQATPGNFDSIFGAIFNTPDTSKDNAGFLFNTQGDTQKQNTSNDAANPSSSTGQDFFSFFGNPNANEAKKSYTDNFFKLF